ncbi:hypothetical protein [Hydrogenobacter thermophilus]|uniref:hypothetical protein n=1 Tax=Hydrogenobacter thermophilus TaxID=940 RepID=UPI0030FA5911
MSMKVNLKNACLVERDKQDGVLTAYFGGYFEDMAVVLDDEPSLDGFYMIDSGDVVYYINPAKVCFVDIDEDGAVIALEGFYLDDEDETVEGALYFDKKDAGFEKVKGLLDLI